MEKSDIREYVPGMVVMVKRDRKDGTLMGKQSRPCLIISVNEEYNNLTVIPISKRDSRTTTYEVLFTDNHNQNRTIVINKIMPVELYEVCEFWFFLNEELFNIVKTGLAAYLNIFTPNQFIQRYKNYREDTIIPYADYKKIHESDEEKENIKKPLPVEDEVVSKPQSTSIDPFDFNSFISKFKDVKTLERELKSISYNVFSKKYGISICHIKELKHYIKQTKQK